MKKNNIKTLYVKSRAEWRKWLSENFDRSDEVWLVFPKKASKKQRITYNDAVEEALCFGWIDSKVKTLDELNTVQQFSPRNPKSSYSQANIERLKWLDNNNLLHPLVKESAKIILCTEFIFPDDIINTIKSDKLAWENYNKFTPSYQRIRIAYIDSARKRPEEFKKRLKNFIEKTKKNIMIGYGGIDKYY